MNFNCSRLLDEAFKNLWMEMFKRGWVESREDRVGATSS